MAKRIQDFRSFNSSNKNATSADNVVEVAPKPKVNIRNEKLRKNYTKTKTEKKQDKSVDADEKKGVNKAVVAFFVILVITGVGIGCLFSPTFNLRGIIVSDGTNVTRAEILNSFEIEMGINVFKINYKEIKNSVEKLPYIKSAEAKILFPDEIKIDYVERKPFALVKYLESYMVMDKYGYILEINRQNKYQDLPIIYNIEFDTYEIGKQFEDTAKTKYDNVVYLLETAVKNEFSYTISEINYESIGNVKLWIKESDIEVIYGDIDRNFIGDKLNYIEEVLNNTKGKKGKIDLSNSGYLEGKTVFTERF